jgi:Uma2 family endonuclease
MTDKTPPEELEIPPELLPRVDHLITKNRYPVDNIFSAKQQRLLVEPLYSSWGGGAAQRTFIADAKVALFASDNRPPMVPDMFLSMDVSLPAEIHLKQHQAYYFWMFPKAPELVIEIVSDLQQDVLDKKLYEYLRMRIIYYVLFDPEKPPDAGQVRLFVMEPMKYREREELRFPPVGLGLTLWQGEYETLDAVWLRWCDMDGNLIPTGDERARQAEARLAAAEVETARLQAELEQLRGPAADSAV